MTAARARDGRADDRPEQEREKNETLRFHTLILPVALEPRNTIIPAFLRTPTESKPDAEQESDQEETEADGLVRLG